MPLYTHSQSGLTLAVFCTALHCYAWILYTSGHPCRIIEFGETIGRHGAEQAIREGHAELKYQTQAVAS